MKYDPEIDARVQTQLKKFKWYFNDSRDDIESNCKYLITPAEASLQSKSQLLAKKIRLLKLLQFYLAEKRPADFQNLKRESIERDIGQQLEFSCIWLELDGLMALHEQVISRIEDRKRRLERKTLPKTTLSKASIKARQKNGQLLADMWKYDYFGIRREIIAKAELLVLSGVSRKNVASIIASQSPLSERQIRRYLSEYKLNRKHLSDIQIMHDDPDYYEIDIDNSDIP